MLENRAFLIKKKVIASLIIICILSYSFMGLMNVSDAASTYTQSIKSGIDAFPESYKTYLRQIQEQHPTWTFDAYYTGISWDDLVANETNHGHNRVHTSADALSKCSCGNVESGYACASADIIKYYMDPRNFLDSDKKMFQFLESSYNSSYKVETVQNILKNTFMKGSVTFNKDGKNVTMSYAQIIMEAGAASQTSPYAIAIKILQEVGSSGSKSSSGTYTFTYTDGKQYSGYYNFFNFGAYDTGDAVTNGLIYAKNNGWDTPYKAIVGGAQKYSSSYNAAGQNTIYFTKWDVVGNKILKAGETQTVTKNQLFTHQYMTNIKDPNSQSSRLYNTYADNNIIDGALNFVIPVYDNMPVANKMPTALTEKDGDLYYTTGTDIMVRSTPSTSGARVDCISGRDTVVAVLERKTANANGLDWDKVKLANGKIGYIASKYLAPCGTNVTKKAEISNSNIKAIPNLTIKELASTLKFTNYEVTKDGVKKADTDAIGTGYKIKDNSTNKEYTAIVLGDVNGDGKVKATDYMKIKNYIMNTSKLSEVEKKAADVNKDGEIKATDYMKIKNYIMGTSSITI